MSAPDIRIRPARRDDLPAVRDLLAETWHDTYDALIGVAKVTEITDEWHSLSNLTRQIDLPHCAFLVADSNGEIVGHALASAASPPQLVIDRLYVKPAWQRRGLGGRLLAAAVAACPASEVVSLVVEADNAKGFSFYRREGFEPLGEILEREIRHLRMEKQPARRG